MGAGCGSEAETAQSCWCSAGDFLQSLLFSGRGRGLLSKKRNTSARSTAHVATSRGRRDETGCTYHILSERLLTGKEQQLRGSQGDHLDPYKQAPGTVQTDRCRAPGRIQVRVWDIVLFPVSSDYGHCPTFNCTDLSSVTT